MFNTHNPAFLNLFFVIAH